MTDDHDKPHQDEAGRISQTRFGPRPIPKGHRLSGSPYESRTIPPHGDVSPDGRRIWPRPSLATRVIVWGGTGLAVAGATAGAVIALRHVADLIGGNTRDTAPGHRRQDHDADPGFQRRRRDAPPPVDYAIREETSRERPYRQASQEERPRPPRPRRRAQRRNLVSEVETNSRRLTSSVDGVMASLSAALTGFLGVARQAGSVMREFGDAAALVRGLMDRQPQEPGGPHARPSAPEAADKPGDRPHHDPADDTNRTHRL